MKKRLLALLLVFVMLAGLIPMVGASGGGDETEILFWASYPGWEPIDNAPVSIYLDGTRVFQGTTGQGYWRGFIPASANELTVRISHPNNFPLISGASFGGDGFSGNEGPPFMAFPDQDGTFTVCAQRVRSWYNAGFGGEFSPTATRPQTLPGTPFTDVGTDIATATAVKAMFDRGLMNGTSDTTFEPNISLDRAMLATMLHRMTWDEDTVFRPVFSDIAPGRWYSEAVVWASDNGIVNGVGDGRFAPTQQLARQELAVMLYRYMRVRLTNMLEWFDDIDVDAIMAVPSHVQAPSGTASWANDAMRWAVHNGLFVSAGAPTAYATRGDVAIFVYIVGL